MAGHLRAYLAEFVGTFALILIGAGSICADAATGGKLGITGIAFAHGLTIMAMAYAYGPISGGHFNPAVTLALLLNGRMDAVKTIGYVSAQLLGAALGATALSALFHNYEFAANPPYLGACDLTQIGFKGGTLVEALLTFFLVTVIYATAVDARGFKGTAPIAIGLTITMGILFGGALTGAAINPARAFGPAVITGHWANWYVYWIGPLAGAALASLLYETLYLKK